MDKAQKIVSIAQKTYNWLDRNATSGVAILARKGQNLEKYGLKYSHIAFVYKDPETSKWLVIHKLNTCGTDKSAIYRQGLVQFFSDDLFEYDTAIAVLDKVYADKFLAVVNDDYKITLMNQPIYSMLANPWDVKYQQSNQWVNETFAYLQEPSIISRERAQAWLRFKGYNPSEIAVSPMQRTGARMTKAHISFDDHTKEELASNNLKTTTADSVISFLVNQKYALSWCELPLVNGLYHGDKICK